MRPIAARRINAALTSIVGVLLATTTALGASPSTTGTTRRAAQHAAVKTFDSPQQAAAALIEAADAFDTQALKQLFGPAAKDVIFTKEPAQDRQRAKEFVAKAREKENVSVDPKNRNRAILLVGNQDWPFPAPIVKRGAKWSFDLTAARRDILYRRIGANELDAIAICHGYVESQHEYALKKREGDEVNQYAQRIISTPGEQDGLAWQNPDGTWGGPIGENVARAIDQGYATGRGEPYHGYFFKILKGQGPAAPLGQLDYVVKGAMIGGFALAAAPSKYGVTGVKTFIVSQDGVVYEKDLGPNTLQAFSKMERFNPDKTWTPVIEE
jgi:hypothetical protein